MGQIHGIIQLTDVAMIYPYVCSTILRIIFGQKDGKVLTDTFAGIGPPTDDDDDDPSDLNDYKHYDLYENGNETD